MQIVVGEDYKDLPCIHKLYNILKRVMPTAIQCFQYKIGFLLYKTWKKNKCNLAHWSMQLNETVMEKNCLLWSAKGIMC